MRLASTLGVESRLEERRPCMAHRALVYGTLFSLLLWACIICLICLAA